MKKLIVFLAVAFSVLGLSGPSMATLVASGSYLGHNYEVIVWDGTAGNWNAARTAANVGGWDLVAITSAGEQTFVASLLNAYNTGTNPINHFWIGGYQTAGVEPSTTWNWVTGEAFGGYTNWAAGMPNDSLDDQDWLQIGSEWGAGLGMIQLLLTVYLWAVRGDTSGRPPLPSQSLPRCSCSGLA